MCGECQRQQDADRRMWLAIRRALLMAAAAIQKRYDAEPAQVDNRRAA